MRLSKSLKLFFGMCVAGNSHPHLAPAAPDSYRHAMRWMLLPLLLAACTPERTFHQDDKVVDNVVELPANYVTCRATLDGVKEIRVRVRLDDFITAKTPPFGPGMITAYFQRKNDDWKTETNRWYATFATVITNGPGEYEIVAPLDGRWTAVLTSDSHTSPNEFRDALENVDRIGFVLGGGTGYGHGVVGLKPITILEFSPQCSEPFLY